MPQFVIRWAIHALSLWAAAWLVDGVSFSGAEGTPAIFSDVLIVALVWGFVNAFIKPFMALAACGFYVLTLGLFTFVMNALMLELTAWLSGQMLVVTGFWAAFWGALVISIVSTLLTSVLDPHNEDEDDGPGEGGVIVLEGR